LYTEGGLQENYGCIFSLKIAPPPKKKCYVGLHRGQTISCFIFAEMGKIEVIEESKKIVW